MRVAIEIPRLQTEDAEAFFVQAALNVLARANAAWYLEQWDENRDPPCCVGCAGLKWSEPGKNSTQTFVSAETMYRDPRKGWSCGEIAAAQAGAKIAGAIKAGGSGEGYSVKLESVGNRKWHAVLVTPEGIEDPSRETLTVGSAGDVVIPRSVLPAAKVMNGYRVAGGPLGVTPPGPGVYATKFTPGYNR